MSDVGSVVDLYEDWIEALFWEFDTKKKAGNLSERDVFKGVLRKVIRKVIEDQLWGGLNKKADFNDAEDVIQTFLESHRDYINSISYEGYAEEDRELLEIVYKKNRKKLIAALMTIPSLSAFKEWLGPEEDEAWKNL